MEYPWEKIHKILMNLLAIVTAMSQTKVKLRTIPMPAEGTRTVLELQGKFPAFKGKGDTDLVCGNCGQVLVEGMGGDAVIKNIVIKCPNCGNYNELPLLSFAEVKQKITAHLETALGIKDFRISYAKLEGNIWKINIEYTEKLGTYDLSKSGMFDLDAATGEVLEFKRDSTWRY
jgi:ribosomal protein S27E